MRLATGRETEDAETSSRTTVESVRGKLFGAGCFYLKSRLLEVKGSSQTQTRERSFAREDVGEVFGSSVEGRTRAHKILGLCLDRVLNDSGNRAKRKSRMSLK